MSALSEMKVTSLITVKCILFLGITVIIFNYFFLIVIKRVEKMFRINNQKHRNQRKNETMQNWSW